MKFRNQTKNIITLYNKINMNVVAEFYIKDRCLYGYKIIRNNKEKYYSIVYNHNTTWKILPGYCGGKIYEVKKPKEEKDIFDYLDNKPEDDYGIVGYVTTDSNGKITAFISEDKDLIYQLTYDNKKEYYPRYIINIIDNSIKCVGLFNDSKSTGYYYNDVGKFGKFNTNNIIDRIYHIELANNEILELIVTERIIREQIFDD